MSGESLSAADGGCGCSLHAEAGDALERRAARRPLELDSPSEVKLGLDDVSTNVSIFEACSNGQPTTSNR